MPLNEKQKNSVRTPYRIMLAGAGDRGQSYMEWVRENPEAMELSALADPISARQQILIDKHKISESLCFEDWQDMLEAGIEADGVIIATQDNQHLEPARAFLAKGYHVLLEKPMAVDIDSIKKIQKAAEKSEGTLTVCHVLRYAPLFKKIKEICDSGSLGKIQSMYHAENVSWYHYVHSYVRGNWGNSKKSSPLILAKSCHDLDLIQWMMPGNATSILSTAQRSVFVENNDRPERCSAACPEYSSCKFEAQRSYLYGRSMKLALSRLPGLPGLAAKVIYHKPALARFLPGLKKYPYWTDWPTSTISDDLSPGAVKKALETGPYGRCVYHCDNDQPEHWESIIEFDSGASAVFRLHGMSREEGRTLRIDGTEGTLDACFGNKHEIRVTFHSGKPGEKYSFSSRGLGHSAADFELMDDWYKVLNGADPQSSASVSALSHYMAFAACEAWVTGAKVKL